MVNSKSKHCKGVRALRYKYNVVGLMVAFLIGILVGRQQQQQTMKSSMLKTAASAAGSVQRLHEIPLRPTSHVGVSKRQLIEPFAVPRLSGYAVSSIQRGQKVESHQHQTMHEFFYVTKGTGIFEIQGKEIDVSPGTFLHIAPGEMHSITVPKGSQDGDLELLYSGVTLD